jgi:hypothetical protein
MTRELARTGEAFFNCLRKRGVSGDLMLTILVQNYIKIGIIPNGVCILNNLNCILKNWYSILIKF